MQHRFVIRDILSSIYVRIPVLFLLLLINMGFALIMFSAREAVWHTIEAEQRLYVTFAEKLANEVRANHNTDTLSQSKAAGILTILLKYNPAAQAYILDSEGKILASSISKEEWKINTVPLSPIRELLKDPTNAFPILGLDPVRLDRPKAFSAAKFTVGNEDLYAYVILRAEPFVEELRKIRNRYIAKAVTPIVVGAVLVTGIIGVVIFAYFTRKFRLMTDVVTQFANGELSNRILLPANDELGKLAQAFNGMADRLEENIEELQKTDRLRRELLSNISHDLRTPVTSIRGFAELMTKSSVLTEEKRKKYSETIYHSAITLERLIAQLFELSKLDAREKRPEFQNCSLRDIIATVISQMQPVTEQKLITVTANLPEVLPDVCIDPELIERVFLNLIGNATKYSPEKSSIEIVCALRDTESVEVIIRDNGPGVAAEELPHLFERYYRANIAKGTKVTGTGLGLTIVQKILEAHGSSVRAESELGKGLAVYFSLPLKEPAVDRSPRIIPIG